MALSDRDYYRMFGLDIDEIRKCENDNYFKGVKDSREWYKQKLKQIRAEIADYGSILVEYKITGHRDKDIEQIVEDVLKQAKAQVLDVIDKTIKEVEQ